MIGIGEKSENLIRTSRETYVFIQIIRYFQPKLVTLYRKLNENIFDIGIKMPRTVTYSCAWIKEGGGGDNQTYPLKHFWKLEIKSGYPLAGLTTYLCPFFVSIVNAQNYGSIRNWHYHYTLSQLRIKIFLLAMSLATQWTWCIVSTIGFHDGKAQPSHQRYHSSSISHIWGNALCTMHDSRYSKCLYVWNVLLAI